MIKTEGIILNEMRYKEASKILTVYTKGIGKISIMAQGALRPKSRLIASTQVFSHSEFQLRKGRDFYYLTQVDLIDSFYSIRDNIDRIVYGSYLLELIDKSTPLDEENEKLFHLLQKGLYILTQEDMDYLKLIVSYELKYISFLGYRPYLNNCVICNDKKSSFIKFSNIYGGLICEKCVHEDTNSLLIDNEMLTTLNKLMFIRFEDLAQVAMPLDVLMKCHNLLTSYILYNIDRKEFKSLNVINKLII